jgi:hypothetical protein
MSFHFNNRRVHAATQHSVLYKVREGTDRPRDSDTPHVAPEDASEDEDLSDPAAESHDPLNYYFSSEFISVNIREMKIFIRKADYWVNVTHILNAAKIDRGNLERLKTSPEFEYQVVRGHWRFQGTYIPPNEALKLCQTYNLQDFVGPLQRVTPTINDQLTQAAPQLPKYFAISDSQNTVSVRKDGYVNLTHILQVRGESRLEVANLKTQRRGLHYETIRGDVKVQGTYIELSEAVKICEEYGLWSVAVALRDYKPRNSVLCPAKRLRSTKEFVPHSPDGTLTRQVLSPTSTLPSDGLQHPGDAEQRARSQSQSPCEIPSLPHLSANSIDNMTAVKRGDSPLSPTNRDRCDQAIQRTKALLHSMPHFAPNIMSQESHLNQISPSFGIEVSSINYAKFLDEDDNLPFLIDCSIPKSAGHERHHSAFDKRTS